jgi:hypothetical protein
MSQSLARGSEPRSIIDRAPGEASAEQPAEEAAYRAAHDGSDPTKCGSDRGTSPGASGDITEFAEPGANHFGFLIGEKNRSLQFLVCRCCSRHDGFILLK